MNPYRSSIYSDIQCIELFINSINKVSQQYKEYYTIILIKFQNYIIFDNKIQILYKDKFDKLNISLYLFIKKYTLNIIKYITNLFDKYNISKQVILFNIFNFSYKKYSWIENFEDLTVNYIVFDLNIILNYFLNKLILYKNKRKNWNGYAFSFEDREELKEKIAKKYH